MAKEKNKMNFRDEKSLTPVKNILNEASLAVSDKSRTVAKSPIAQTLKAAATIGAGSAISFASLYFAGTIGLSAAGITSGLAAAGGLIGGGMATGIGIIASPVLIAGGVVTGAVLYHKNKKLKQEKELCYKEAIKKQNAIITALKEESNADKERIEYLNSINKLLEAAIRDLKADLNKKQEA